MDNLARHLHLHVISADLLSETMVNKKHYNSFHPKLGFFLHIQEVLEWFDAEPTFFSNKVSRHTYQSDSVRSFLDGGCGTGQST